MKTDKVSFGQTYIRPTLFQNLSKQHHPKVMSLIPLGELYPVDMYLGANREGDLVVDILHSTLGKFLYFAGEIPKTIENVAMMQFWDSAERINRRNNGYKLPVYNIKIQNLDYFTTPELQHTVHVRIAHYLQNMIDKRFFN